MNHDRFVVDQRHFSTQCPNPCFLTREQGARRAAGRPPLLAADVLKALLSALDSERAKSAAVVVASAHGRRLVTVHASNRQGVTLRLRSGSGASQDEVLKAVRRALAQLEIEGRGLQR
jgi:ParB family chromosome partitioning protein